MAKSKKGMDSLEKRVSEVEKRLDNFDTKVGSKVSKACFRDLEERVLKFVKIIGIVVVVIGILIAVVMYHGSRQIENLKESNKELSNKVKVLEGQKSDKTESNYENYEAYIDTLFESDGTLYKSINNKAEFFLDMNLTNPIQNPIFCSKDKEFIGANEDGLSVYMYRMSNKYLCYSSYNLDSWKDFIRCE